MTQLDFEKELAQLLKKHSVNIDVGIPETVLASYIESILNGLNIVKLDLTTIKYPFVPVESSSENEALPKRNSDKPPPRGKHHWE